MNFDNQIHTTIQLETFPAELTFQGMEGKWTVQNGESGYIGSHHPNAYNLYLKNKRQFQHHFTVRIHLICMMHELQWTTAQPAHSQNITSLKFFLTVKVMDYLFFYFTSILPGSLRLKSLLQEGHDPYENEPYKKM